jgi:DNA repair and recombination protein RAD54 and RAD54-like protein
MDSRIFDSEICGCHRYLYLAIDGTMSIKKRQKNVEQFNNAESKERVMILSSKAGG